MMYSLRHRLLGAAVLGLTCTALINTGHADADPAQQMLATPEGVIITPGSSIPRPGAVAHTNVHIFRPAGARPFASAPSGKYETPASLACLYGLTAKVTGCNPETLSTVTTGGSRMVAIVDAYDYPSAEADLAHFSSEFGLPAITGSNFKVVYATGTKPKTDSTGGWELEEALDVQMAHALAPKATVVLVEAASSSTSDLLAAEKVAGAMVAAAGGGEVSNSWGGSESANEASYEADFMASNVVFFASAGDSPGVEFPSVLPDVVGVGGTSVNRTGSGNFTSQTTWTSTGGGNSAHLSTPSYQSSVTNIVGTHRGVPDVALVANPNTGVWIYDTNKYMGSVLDWTVIGGTSVASPAVAAIVNNVGSFNASSTAELNEIYANLGVAANFTDIKSGKCRNAASGSATAGYDLCTGVGTPLGFSGK